jgi:hypothetical protein
MWIQTLITVDLCYLFHGILRRLRNLVTSGVKDQQPSAFEFASARILICLAMNYGGTTLRL